MLVSCGSNNNFNHTRLAARRPNPATIKVHVFVSNPLFSNGTSTAPVLNVVDGQRDLLSPSVISVGATSPNPGLMVLFPNKRFTLVFSASNNSLTVVNNATQSVAQNSGGNTELHHASGLHRKYRGGAGQCTGFAAVPTAPVNRADLPGVVEVLNLSDELNFGHDSGSGRSLPGAEPQRQPHSGSGQPSRYGDRLDAQLGRHQHRPARSTFKVLFSIIRFGQLSAAMIRPLTS